MLSFTQNRITSNVKWFPSEMGIAPPDNYLGEDSKNPVRSGLFRSDRLGTTERKTVYEWCLFFSPAVRVQLLAERLGPLLQGDDEKQATLNNGKRKNLIWKYFLKSHASEPGDAISKVFCVWTK